MLIFSCIVLGIPLIVGASDGVSPPVGIFEGLFSRFGPQVSRLHSRQNLLVPPECEKICDTFQTTVQDCPDAACACTVQNMNTGLSCVECAVSEIPGEVTTAQTVLNNFAQECAVYGSSLNVPTVTLSGSVTPSAGSGPTDGAPTGSSAPPTGIPSSDFNGVTNAASTTSSPSQTGPTSSTTGSAGSNSGAVRVGKTAEVICVLFSVCLTAVLVSVP